IRKGRTSQVLIRAVGARGRAFGQVAGRGIVEQEYVVCAGVERLADHDAGLRCAATLQAAHPGDHRPVTGKGLVDKMETVGGGEKSPLARSRHGERPVRVIGTPGHAHRADIPVGPTQGSVGTDWTVREFVVVFVKLPDEPVTVTVTVPVVAMLPADCVNVLVLAVLLGLNDAVTPLGRPDADKLTLPLKPFCGVTVMVLVPVVPRVIVKLFGDAERV